MLESIRSIPRFFTELLRGCPDPPSSIMRGRAPMIVGHRGAPCVEIENTIPSFARALDVEHANGIELDLCLTSDGEVIVWHDWDPDTTTTLARIDCLEPDVRCHPVIPTDDRLRRRISQLTLAQVREHYGYADKRSPGQRLDCMIPTLEQFIAWAVQQPSLEILFLDTKIPSDEPDAVPRLMTRVLEILDRARPHFNVVFETMEPAILASMKRFAPAYDFTLDIELPNGIILRPERWSPIAAAHRHENTFATLEYPRAVIAPWTTYRRIVRHDFERLASSERDGDRRVRLFGFTVNERSHMSCLLRLGIDGLQTDRPGLLAEVVSELREADPLIAPGSYPEGALEA